MRILLAVALAACIDSDEEWGTVYDCGGGVEYSYHDDAAAEVSALAGRACEPSSILDRAWPGITNLFTMGCVYSCDPHTG